MKPPKVVSREYKIMMDHRLFQDRKAALLSFLDEVDSLAKEMDIGFKNGELKTRKRSIQFLDTIDSTLLLNGLVLRKRIDVETSKTEFTLKSRSPDRYLAAAAEIQPEKSLKSEMKLEEDISAPFRVQFSHSATCESSGKNLETISDAVKLLPGLARLKRDGIQCDGTIRLHPVNAMTMFERVMKGPSLKFGETDAEIALILWSNGEAGRPLVAEFSFRYADKDENYSEATVRQAKTMFESLQRLDWFLPEGKTKTQFAYHA